MTGTRFLLIRHASCDPVGRSIAGRAEDIRLNERGRAEAERLAARLSALPLAAVYTSPLERARETALAIAAPHGLDAESADGLLELDFGTWTGRDLHTLEADPVWRRFITFRASTRPPGGELMVEAQSRAVALFSDLRARHPHETVAAVTHADIIRSVIVFFLGMPLDLLLRLEIAPASISVLVVDDHAPTLLRLNDTGPLEE